MDRTEREIDRVLLDVILLDGEQDEAPDLSDMARRSKAILAKRDEERRRRRRTGKVVAVPGKSRAQRKVERNDRARRIRAAVFARAGGRCEFCAARHEAHPDHRIQRPEELHHIIGGGLRRKMESTETTAAICIDCHRGWGRSDPEVLAAAKAWALRGGRRLALREIDHRIWKANEARESTARRATP